MKTMKIEQEQIENLRKLSNAGGVSGAEGAVRDLVLEQVKALADEVQEDALGNVIARKKGKVEGGKKVMLVAHMDEIGLMITTDDGDGLYGFSLVGEVDLRQLPGKAVYVGKERVPGVIGARAIHLTTAEQRQAAIPLETLRIDMGPQVKVKMGDRAVFATELWENGLSLFGKALDDRLGVVTLIELMKVSPDHLDLYFVFSSQKEIGNRGDIVAAYNINPDAVVQVDSAAAFDLPASDSGLENVTYESRLGYGPVIYPMYRKMISDPALFEFFIQIAEEQGIPYQIRQAVGQDTRLDRFGALNCIREGLRTITISIPGRYPHTAIGLARIADWQNTLQLLMAGLMKIDTVLT